MSRLIVVCGLSGSGKTTFAEALSKRLNIVCLHKDSIKESLYDVSGGKTIDDSKKLGLWSVRILLSLAEEQIRRGVDLIIESPFNYEEEAKSFASWKEKYSLDFYAVVCGIDEAVRRDRYTERAKRVRHAAHHDLARLDEAMGGTTDKTFRLFDYSIMPEKKIFVTTDQPVGELVDRVVAKLYEN